MLSVAGRRECGVRGGLGGATQVCGEDQRTPPHPGYAVLPSILGLRVFGNFTSLGWHHWLHGGTKRGPRDPWGPSPAPSPTHHRPSPPVSPLLPAPCRRSCSGWGPKLRSTTRKPCRRGKSLRPSPPRSRIHAVGVALAPAPHGGCGDTGRVRHSLALPFGSRTTKDALVITTRGRELARVGPFS